MCAWHNEDIIHAARFAMLSVGRILREQEIVDMGQIMEILMITYPISI